MSITRPTLENIGLSRLLLVDNLSDDLFMNVHHFPLSPFSVDNLCTCLPFVYLLSTGYQSITSLIL